MVDRRPVVQKKKSPQPKAAPAPRNHLILERIDRIRGSARLRRAVFGVPPNTSCHQGASVYYVARAFHSRVFHDKLATGKSPEPADKNVCAACKMEPL